MTKYENKELDLVQIINQIYSFLLMFTKYEIAVVQKFSYAHQMEYIKRINKLSQIFHCKDSISTKYTLLLIKDHNYKPSEKFNQYLHKKSFYVIILIFKI